MAEWQHLFTLQGNAKVKSGSKGEEDRKLKLLDKRVVLQTPAKMRINAKIKRETDEDDTFFDTETVTRFDIPDDVKSAWSSLQGLFQSFFGSYALGVSDMSSQTFGLLQDIRTLEKSNIDVGTDLETLRTRLQAIQGQLGDTIRVGNVEVPNVNHSDYHPGFVRMRCRGIERRNQRCQSLRIAST